MHVIALLPIEWEFISIINCTCFSATIMGTRPLNKGIVRIIFTVVALGPVTC